MITVAEGNSVYIRLKNPTHLYDTCKLIDPSDNERHHEIDPVHYQSCGFIIQNAQQIDNGEWTIIYGSSIVYKAYIEINVIGNIHLISYFNFDDIADCFHMQDKVKQNKKITDTQRQF